MEVAFTYEWGNGGMHCAFPSAGYERTLRDIGNGWWIRVYRNRNALTKPTFSVYLIYAWEALL
jgi:hypothetical protein